MAVTEALMSLFLRERISPEEVMKVADNIEAEANIHKEKREEEEAPPPDQEAALLRWAGVCCATTEKKARSEIEETDGNSSLPPFPRPRDLSDLSDGVSLASVVAVRGRASTSALEVVLGWRDLALGQPPSMADSLHNLR